jgi:hypothetical protein
MMDSSSLTMLVASATSTGTSGDTVRKVVYFQSYPQLPLEIFPYSLLSQ